MGGGSQEGEAGRPTKRIEDTVGEGRKKINIISSLCLSASAAQIKFDLKTFSRLYVRCLQRERETKTKRWRGSERMT